MKQSPKVTTRLFSMMVFCLVLCFGLFVLNRLSYQNQELSGPWNGWSNLAKNSVDVLFLGNSHVECTVAPLQIYSDTGITSWNLKATSCNMPIRYFYLKEALKTQHPKLIALEVYTGERGVRLNDGENLVAYGMMPFGLNRIAGTSVTATPTVAASFALPLISGHQNLLKLDFTNFKTKLFKRNNMPNSTAGANVIAMSKAKPINPVAIDEQSFPVPSDDDYKVQLRYAKKIIQLAQDNNIQVLVWFAPTAYKNQSHYFDKMEKDISSEYGYVEYLDMNRYRSELGLTPDDYSDPGHLNICGQKKATTWLENYLVKKRFVASPSSDDSWWAANEESWRKTYQEASRQ